MLPSAKPRSPPPRPSHTPSSSQSTISSPPASQATVIIPSPSGPRRPSISSTMHWLSRSANHNSVSPAPNPHAAPRPVRISEPKFVRGMDSLTQQRTGVLGAGATVVRTPDDALREISSRSQSDDVFQQATSQKSKKRRPSVSKSIIPPSLESVSESLSSPPLPPLPFPESDEEAMLSRSSSGSSKPHSPRLPAAITHTPIPAVVPLSPPLRPSLKARSVPSSEDRDAVPPIPSNVPPSPPPSFKPILVSEVPAFSVDPERIIVTLETCTTTYRTTLETLNSRPSHLSKYITSLLARQRSDSDSSSLYSNPGDDNDDLEIYRKHLASQGLLPQSSYEIHIFLDRPSAPYAHILSYLRSPTGTPENPESIPRAVLYQSSSQATRLETLIELRDEAAYLNLDGLHKMCLDEMVRMRHAPKMHTRGSSGSGPSMGSVQSLRASVYTLYTLLERVETDIRSSGHSLPVYELRQQSSREKDYTTSDPPHMFAPPIPPSWEGPSHRRNISMQPVRPAPGWI